LVRLTGYVVVELKTGKSQPEFAGKLNFYLALVDHVLRQGFHNDTVGILHLRNQERPQRPLQPWPLHGPMAVAAYTYDKLPAAEQQALPNEGHLIAALE
jgi:hypothetical protein